MNEGGASEGGAQEAGAAGAQDAGAAGTAELGPGGGAGADGTAGEAGAAPLSPGCKLSSPPGSACQSKDGPGVCCDGACLFGQCCETKDCAQLGAGFVCTVNQCENVAATLSGLLSELPCTGPADETHCATQKSATVAATLGGTAGVTYDVELRFRGVVEQKSYLGGCRDGGNWQSEGQDNGDAYNIFRLSVSSPAQTFFLNVGEFNANTIAIDYDKKLRIDAGATVTLYADAKDGAESKNLASDGSPVFVNGTTVLQPYNGQFIQMSVLSVAPDPYFSAASADGASAGTALSFDGGQVVTVPATEQMQSDNVTTEAWFYASNSSENYRALFGKAYQGESVDSYVIWLGSGALNAGINLESEAGAASIAFNAAKEWHHVAASYDYRAELETLYLDGIAVACVTMRAQIKYDNHPLELGGDIDGEMLSGFWNGQLDELRLFASVRTPDQIWGDMHTHQLGPTTGLIGEWTFNEGSGQIAADSSGNGLNAVLGSTNADEDADPAWVPSTAPH